MKLEVQSQSLLIEFHSISWLFLLFRAIDANQVSKAKAEYFHQITYRHLQTGHSCEWGLNL